MAADGKVVSINEAEATSKARILSCSGTLGGKTIPFHAGQSDNDFDHVLSRHEIALNVSTVQNGFLLIGPGVDGVVFDRCGSRIGDSSYYTNATFEQYDLQFLKRNARDLPGSLFCAFDASWRNYYHWTIMGLGRAMLYRRFCANKHALIIPDRKGRDAWGWKVGFSYDVWRESLIRTGIVDNSVVVENGIYRVRSIDIMWLETRWGEIIEQPPYVSFFPDLYSEFQRMTSNAPHGGGRKIIVSRPHDARISPNANDALQRLARYENFDFVDLERMRLDDQIEAFASAHVIVAPHGAGLSNLVYASPSAHVIELSKPINQYEKLRPWFYLLSAGMDQSYSYVDLSLYTGGTSGLYDRLVEFSHL